METWKEVQAKLRAELNQWFIKQCRNTSDDYYLYYHPTTPERDGGFLLSKECPGDGYLLGRTEPVHKGKTVEQNFSKLNDVLRRLPIMSGG